jgi:hypothetical protein
MFSLGVTLYYWVTGEYPFIIADYTDPHYYYLMTNPARFWSIKESDLGK